jgi:hypothetical protein
MANTMHLRRLKMELGTDYKFRDDLFDSKEEGTTVPIELTLDPFAGIVYRYTTVGFKLGEDDIPRIQFDYEIIKTNDLSMMTLRKNEKFNTTLGLILNAMLLDMADMEGEIETRTDNPKEPDQE